MIKCIIFDCDGTLVDSEYLCNLAFEIKLKEYNIEANAQALMQKYRGGKLANIIQSLESEHQITFNDDFIKEYRELVDQLFENNLQPCLGVIEALSLILLPICVASSGPVIKIKKALKVTQLSDFFEDHIFSSYDVGSWKPEPGLFIHTAKQMGYAPDECLVVEDSIVGITAANLAGMKSVLFDPHGIHDPALSPNIIKNMKELSNYLG